MPLSSPVPIAVLQMEKSAFEHWNRWYVQEGERGEYKRWNQLLDYPWRSSPIVYPSGGWCSSALVEFVLKLVYWLDARSKGWISIQHTKVEGAGRVDVLEGNVALLRCKKILKLLLEGGYVGERPLYSGMMVRGGRKVRNMQLHDSGSPAVRNELLKLCNFIGAKPIRGQISEPDLDLDCYFAIACVLPRGTRSGHLRLKVTPLEGVGAPLSFEGERLKDFPVVLCGCNGMPSGRFGDSNFLDSSFKWTISISSASTPATNKLNGVSRTERLKIAFSE